MRDRTQFGGCSLSRYDLLIVLGLFTCSSLLYAVLGVRFEASTVLSMQFIDPALLTERMGESLWYYHATPPALNLLTVNGLTAAQAVMIPMQCEYYALEGLGQLLNTISIVKKRGSAHERSIREFRLEAGRISVGEPLKNFRGVLTGVPQYEAVSEPLREGKNF